MECRSFDQKSAKNKWKSKQRGFPAVNRGHALRGMIEEHGGKAGAAAEEAVGADGVGGDGDLHRIAPGQTQIGDKGCYRQ